jgi:hypothetical protein
MPFESFLVLAQKCFGSCRNFFIPLIQMSIDPMIEKKIVAQKIWLLLKIEQ